MRIRVYLKQWEQMWLLARRFVITGAERNSEERPWELPSIRAVSKDSRNLADVLGRLSRLLGISITTKGVLLKRRSVRPDSDLRVRTRILPTLGVF